jgi:hypothetical protein
MAAIPEILGAVAPDAEPVSDPPSPPVLIISGQQAGFSPAAGVPVPSKKLRIWIEVTTIVIAAARRLLRPMPESRPGRRHYPKNYGFLEQACMARAMHRL